MKIALALLCTFATFAAEPFYLGRWKIASAAPAPWSSPERKPPTPESKMLTGKVVVIETKRITGPRQVACAKPNYHIRDSGADMLFQGQFAEMKTRDQSVDIPKAAATAGFRNGTQWKTLETGCEGALDFHFIDDSTAAFGLNNIIYTLKKQ